jgi:septal ring factor EnvC (AmiA/AmiB activator)
MAEPTTAQLFSGIVTLIVLIAGLWIREYFKHRSWKKNNGSMARIENDIKDIKTCTKSLNGRAQNTEKDVGIIKNEIKNFHYDCKKYEKGITQNARDILTLHKEKADK